MDLQTLLERVEPSRLKQLGSLLALGESLTKPELVDWVSQELPFCQVEEDGACVGIDGAFYIAVDWVCDMTTLELLRDSSWVRRQSDGKVIEFRVTEAASEISVGDARLLLALLSIATYNEGELPVPRILTSNRFENCLVIEESDDGALSGRPSQRPSQLPPPSQRPSIPPGFSPTFDSMRPQRNSVRPEAVEAAPESRRIDPDLIEWVLTLSRHSIIAAAFALVERGVDTHAIAVDPTGGRAVLPADAIEAAEKLFDDHRESLPPPSQSDSVLSYRKRLAHSLSFFGISPSDASALVTLTVELGCFPDFWSKSNPPPRGLARQELQNAPDELMKSAAKLLYDAFYAEQYPSVDALIHVFVPTATS
jgi:hypothetical protein